MNEKISRRRTAIITWISYLNFGTFLQAYALQNVLKSLGYPNTIVSDRQLLFTEKPKVIQNLKQFLLNILHPRKVWIENHRKIQRFKKFAQDYLNIDNEWNSVGELSSKYDTFVCGSDQIWSPILPNYYDGFYFASFAEVEKLHVAYAPSLGIKSSVTSEYAETIRPWLDKFKSISIREKTGAEIISRITGRKDIETVLDPTLLLTSEQWKKLESHNKKPMLQKYKPYMLAYFLTFNELYLKRAYELAHSKGLQLVCLNTSKIPQGQIDKLAIGVGPMDFLSLIANSEFVFTDSFHGTIFSIQFHKPFITVKRFADTSNINQNSRIENLFNVLGISDNLLDEKTLLMEPTVPNWEEIDLVLGKERKSSLSFLKNALNK